MTFFKLFQTFSKNSNMIGDKKMKFDRQNEILNLLKSEHCLSIKELSRRIYSSESSVRRDLEYLERCGFIKKVYGGAVLAEYENDLVPVSLRDSSNSAIKEKIAQKASKEVFDGAVIFMDSSSTVMRITKYLSSYKNLKIITNNLRIFEEAKKLNIDLYCTGGKYDRIEEMFAGALAEKHIKDIYADIMFFSCRGISKFGDITDISEAQISLRKAMMEHSKTKIFLCDSTKFGIVKAFRLCGKDDVDKIICDAPLSFENIKNKSLV